MTHFIFDIYKNLKVGWKCLLVCRRETGIREILLSDVRTLRFVHHLEAEDKGDISDSGTDHRGPNTEGKWRGEAHTNIEKKKAEKSIIGRLERYRDQLETSCFSHNFSVETLKNIVWCTQKYRLELDLFLQMLT